MDVASSVTLQKSLGVFYTPDGVAKTLVKWAVRRTSDWLLDPACGDGRFLAEHARGFGVDCDAVGATHALARAPQSTIHVGDFFAWAHETTARFDCAAGNPPFIRYQHFAGEDRENALSHCRKLGADFTALSSSWAPFLVVTASLLKPGGRMAFVVPAEIGHAPYSVPLIRFLTSHFSVVQLIAIREKVFTDLSEDVWLLYAEGYGAKTDRILLSEDPSFVPRRHPPTPSQTVSLRDWSKWNNRVRPFLLPAAAREVYLRVRDSSDSLQMRDVARVGIGYVTGANDFFHLRPSQARLWRIPDRCLLPTVRNSRALPPKMLTPAAVRAWMERDEPFLLLRLRADEPLPEAV
jgi:SAM-dependent methyltransferase